jgi:hypothetical protein
MFHKFRAGLAGGKKSTHEETLFLQRMRNYFIKRLWRGAFVLWGQQLDLKRFLIMDPTQNTPSTRTGEFSKADTWRCWRRAGGQDMVSPKAQALQVGGGRVHRACPSPTERLP